MEIAREDRSGIIHVCLEAETLTELFEDVSEYVEDISGLDLFGISYDYDSNEGYCYAHLFVYDRKATMNPRVTGKRKSK